MIQRQVPIHLPAEVEVWIESAPSAAMEASTAAFHEAHGSYQRGLIRGYATWSGSSLSGVAKDYGARYAESRKNLQDRLGLTIASGPHNKLLPLWGQPAEDLHRYYTRRYVFRSTRYDRHRARRKSPNLPAGWEVVPHAFLQRLAAALQPPTTPREIRDTIETFMRHPRFPLIDFASGNDAVALGASPADLRRLTTFLHGLDPQEQTQALERLQAELANFATVRLLGSVQW